MARTMLIKVKALIDGTGQVARGPSTLAIRDGLIQSIDPAEQTAPADPEVAVLDAADLWALPGLVDAHVHLGFSAGRNPLRDLLADDDETMLLRATHNAQVALCAGITTVRDCGGRHQTIFSLRNAIQAGIIAGPRVVAAGMPITTTGGHCYWLGLEADSAAETRQAARRMVRAGADYLKIMATGGGMTPGTNIAAPQYRVEELGAIVAEGKRLGKHVAAHVHATTGIRNAVAAGVDTLEHCSWVSADGGLDFDERLVDEIARRGIFVDPTLAAGYRAFKQGIDMTPDRRRNFTLRQQRLPCYRQMIEAGVRFLAGTDAGVSFTPLDSLADNLAMLVHELDMTPLAAIQTATQHSALALGLSAEIGTLEPGKRADVVLIEGDPQRDLAALRRVRWVLRDGRLVARDGQLVVGPTSAE